MKLIEENGVIHEALKSFDELEKFLVNKKSFIIKDMPMGMAYKYIIKTLNTNNITHCTVYFSTAFQRFLLSLIAFIIIFSCVFGLSYGITSSFLNTIETRFSALTHNPDAKFYKEIFFDEHKHELKIDDSSDYDPVSRDEDGNIIGYLPRLNPYRNFYINDVSFVYKDTIYVLEYGFILLFCTAISLILASIISFYIAKKYIFITTEYIIVKKIFSNSIEFLHTKE